MRAAASAAFEFSPAFQGRGKNAEHFLVALATVEGARTAQKFNRRRRDEGAKCRTYPGLERPG
jgi:hypothetical protein